jgi:pSer/pThr/pTyr-binding forkhead associated (FHA) protein
MSVQLKLGDDPKVIPLPKDPITVGRSSQNGIAILDASLSRVHCEIRRAGAGVSVKDLGSRNGTLVNGEPVQEKTIGSGDRVDVGICRILLIAERGDFKLQISTGQPDGRKPTGPDTARLREQAATTDDLRRGLVAPGPGANAVAWGRRSGGGATAAVAGVVFLVLVAAVVFLVQKGKGKGQSVQVAEPWRGFDYASPADLARDWKAGPDSPALLALVPARNGNGLELARKPGERGLGVAWGPRAAVAPKKAYRLTAWAKPAGGPAGLRIGWARSENAEPFAWSGTGLTLDEGDLGGTWAVPEGATHAQIALVVAGDTGRAIFDDADFAESELADRPPVAGRVVRAVFEAPGVFHLSSKDSLWIPAAVGVEGVDATCAMNVRRTTAGGAYEIPGASGGATVEVAEERDSERDGFVVRFKVKGNGVRLSLGTADGDVAGHPFGDFVKTKSASVRAGAGRIGLELRPEAEVGLEGGRVVVRFPGAEFEIAFQPEAAGGRLAGLEEASKAEAAKAYGKAIGLYDAIVTANPKGELGVAAAERADALRGLAEEALRRARDRRSDAEFTGNLAACDEAVADYIVIEQYFEGTEYAAQATAEREVTQEMRKMLAAEIATSDIGKLLAAAEAYLNEGRLMLARSYCEAVMDRTSDPDAAARAESLLQRIEAKEKDR